MSRRYSIAEARSNLPAIVDQATGGQEIELTRRGIPVAVVISLGEFTRLRGKRLRFGDAYRRFLEQHVLGDVGFAKGYFDATRNRDPGRKVAL